MTFDDNAKSILQKLFEIAKSAGDLRVKTIFTYEELSSACEIDDIGYGKVICQYLHECGYIDIHSNKGERTFELTGKGISFLFDI